jgi:glyoxylase-like metal-dependent hydrolase (beta-lactamase superfamily II)
MADPAGSWRSLAAGVDYADLDFLGQPGIIATALLQGPDGVAIVDPGPSTTLPVLRRALAAKGVAPADLRAILLTHIHLDHAGATGSLVAESPAATVFVHERGAPHLADPSRLLASAGQLYGADMDRLWGEVRPVPADRLRVLGEQDAISVAGHQLEVVWTPGHAWHHVSYFAPDTRIAFVGDTAGICRPGGRAVVPPTPPPDIDLEAWRASADRILAWEPDVLFLTHFGPQASPRVHFTDLWTRLDDWSRRVRALLERPGTDAERARAFMEDVALDLRRETGRAEAEAYARAGRFDFSWTGLARYWRKKAGRTPTSSSAPSGPAGPGPS